MRARRCASALCLRAPLEPTADLASSDPRRRKKRAPAWWQDPDVRLLVGVMVGSIVVLGGLGASFYAIR